MSRPSTKILITVSSGLSVKVMGDVVCKKNGRITSLLCARRVDRLETLKSEFRKKLTRILLLPYQVTLTLMIRRCIYLVFNEFKNRIWVSLDRVIVKLPVWAKAPQLVRAIFKANKETAIYYICIGNLHNARLRFCYI